MCSLHSPCKLTFSPSHTPLNAYVLKVKELWKSFLHCLCKRHFVSLSFWTDRNFKIQSGIYSFNVREKKKKLYAKLIQQGFRSKNVCTSESKLNSVWEILGLCRPHYDHSHFELLKLRLCRWTWCIVRLDNTRLHQMQLTFVSAVPTLGSFEQNLWFQVLISISCTSVEHREGLRRPLATVGKMRTNCGTTIDKTAGCSSTSVVCTTKASACAVFVKRWPSILGLCSSITLYVVYSARLGGRKLSW